MVIMKHARQFQCQDIHTTDVLPMLFATSGATFVQLFSQDEVIHKNLTSHKSTSTSIPMLAHRSVKLTRSVVAPVSYTILYTWRHMFSTALSYPNVDRKTMLSIEIATNSMSEPASYTRALVAGTLHFVPST